MTEVKEITAFVCGTDWQFECRDILSRTKLFNTIEELKEQKKCWQECGVVQLEISEVCWLEKPTVPWEAKET